MSSVATEIPEPIPDRSDVGKYVRFAVLDRVAHVGLVLDKLQRQVRRAEGYELLAATGDMKYLTDAVSKEEEMGVNIGNENHYHIQMADPNAAKPSEPTPAEPAKPPVGTTTTEPVTDEPATDPAAPVVDKKKVDSGP